MAATRRLEKALVKRMTRAHRAVEAARRRDASAVPPATTLPLTTAIDDLLRTAAVVSRARAKGRATVPQRNTAGAAILRWEAERERLAAQVGETRAVAIERAHIAARTQAATDPAEREILREWPLQPESRRSWSETLKETGRKGGRAGKGTAKVPHTELIRRIVAARGATAVLDVLRDDGRDGWDRFGIGPPIRDVDVDTSAKQVTFALDGDARPVTVSFAAVRMATKRAAANK